MTDYTSLHVSAMVHAGQRQGVMREEWSAFLESCAEAHETVRQHVDEGEVKRRMYEYLGDQEMVNGGIF
jgi:hypothetical protein